MLRPTLKYLLWVDTKNQMEVTRPWYGKHLPFPLGLYYPNKFEQESVKLIESLYGQYSDNCEIGNDTLAETTVYRGAEECLTILSNRLGESHYMFGRSPSGLDAVMYGYLAPLLKAPSPTNTLQNYLKSCTNLAKFVSRLQDERFEMVYSIASQKLQDKSPDDSSMPDISSFNQKIVAIKENVTRRFDKTDDSLNNLKEWRDIAGHKL